MPDVKISINGKSMSVAAGTSVAAAIVAAGESAFRTSVSGESRGALCGMGICFECRVSINDEQHVRSCQLVCVDGMRVATK